MGAPAMVGGRRWFQNSYAGAIRYVARGGERCQTQWVVRSGRGELSLPKRPLRHRPHVALRKPMNHHRCWWSQGMDSNHRYTVLQTVALTSLATLGRRSQHV